jgi:hypothetical protein
LLDKARADHAAADKAHREALHYHRPRQHA